ncbi:uncharacterized protein LOC134316232 isoform X3 [Trichomycterus rosablanca]|uniref:uncharacterized protein LOC134316232 isoform X3 n=1 Tax=Trichomycterus rosablanca TaxID=2290929 RepID=UPI002F3592B6
MVRLSQQNLVLFVVIFCSTLHTDTMSARILVQDGENATIYCNVGGAPQDGAKCKMDNATYVYYPYLYVISFQFFFVVILVILLGKLCHDLRKNKPVKQSSNSEYEVMRGGQTARFLTNPQYDFTRCNTNNEPEMQICKK